MSKVPKWFRGEVYEEGSIIKNPFTGEETKLDNVELSMYDFIMGCQMLTEGLGGPFSTATGGIQEEMVRGLEWFKTNNPKAYMVLLD